MKNRKKKIVSLFVLVMVIAIRFSPVSVLAEGLSTSLLFSTTSPTVGQTITVQVSISADVDLTNYEAVLTYNPEYFTFLNESSNNKNLAPALATFGINEFSDDQIVVAAYGGTQEQSAKLFQLTFKAIKAGSTNFSVSEVNVNVDYPASKTRSITISEPVPKSDVNTLKSLTVSPGSLSPEFSAGQLQYAVSVGPETERLTISAVPTDSKATVSGGGTVALDEGENTIRLVVTAENGDKRTYTIVANRASVTPTPEPTPTPAVTIELSDGPYQVIEVPDGVSIPAGFYRSLQEMNGQMVPVYKSLRGELALLYLYRQSIGDGFYYLDQQSGQYKPYLVLSVPAQSFTVLTPDDTVAIPEGWTPTGLTIDGKTLPVWKQNGQDQDIYLVYLMDARGNQSFYRYDTTSQLLLLFDPAAVLPEPTGTDPPEATPTSVPTEQLPATPTPNPWTLATAIMGLICLALIGLLIWQGARRGQDLAGSDEDSLRPPPPIRRI